ncbi:MAG TPA: GTP-binding protein [Anaerolineae bacterium]|nr:GTP-binding protein [Anaerolineae bacterium]
MPLLQKKVCLLGDFAVGKTSLVRRFVYDRFDDKYISTIGVKVSRKSLIVPHDGGTVRMNMLLWDMAGGEDFSHVHASYLRGAAGAILVCDLTRAETLESMSRYAGDFWSINPTSPLVIVGNKVDLKDMRAITDAELQAVAESHARSPWFTSSAKTGEHVEELFQALGQLILATR